MKQNRILLFISIIAALAGCKKNDEVARPISLTVHVAYTEADKPLNLPLDKVAVTISNNTNGQSYTAATDATGTASFASVVPGNYSATATLKIMAADYTKQTGVLVTNDVQYNASATGTRFTENAAFNMTLTTGRVGDLIIKQFYYAGSNTTSGASFRDEFVEIYNNANDVIYLDSLFIGNSQASNTKLSAGGIPFDWSKSVGMPTNIGNASKDYIYMRYLIMIPGTGKEHPLDPGKSVVIAQTAINHAQIYTDNAGNQVSIINPALTIDLSKADYEVYMADFKRAEAGNPADFTPYRWDLNNPLVPNVQVLNSSGNDWTFDATGREDLIIFKIPAGKTLEKKSYPDPTVATVTTDTKLYMQVPVGYAIDAMEILPPVPANRIPKRLPDSYDAAGTFVTGGQYSSQSLVRKTAKTLANGRRILQDTNNSQADFFTKTKADPSKTEASFTE